MAGGFDRYAGINMDNEKNAAFTRVTSTLDTTAIDDDNINGATMTEGGQGTKSTINGRWCTLLFHSHHHTHGLSALVMENCGTTLR